ncbi:hypothetical protein WOLCODRAFT_151326 [Wolfiporia cocos MD-104 SS10]|uniref:Uncharacterized protein n=1 Tax=Wolfiporia cocos (strain MD-104) TaxID=742152 RepID=A0A2H3JIA1_WOLCO|nr:hypothetical protein WOLCODRAFT_151326 [Wolfiporia cocos MD-104 SS10]
MAYKEHVVVHKKKSRDNKAYKQKQKQAMNVNAGTEELGANYVSALLAWIWFI